MYICNFLWKFLQSSVNFETLNAKSSNTLTERTYTDMKVKITFCKNTFSHTDYNDKERRRGLTSRAAILDFVNELINADATLSSP